MLQIVQPSLVGIDVSLAAIAPTLSTLARLPPLRQGSRSRRSIARSVLPQSELSNGLDRRWSSPREAVIQTVRRTVRPTPDFGAN